MKSFQEQFTEIQDISKLDSTADLTKIKRWNNDTWDIVYAYSPWKFLEKTDTIATTTDGGRYELGNDVRKIITVTTTPDSGTTVYRPEGVEDPDFWEYLQSLNVGSSDFTEYFYLEDNDLLIWPDYATASKTITVRFRRQGIHMSLDDYSIGTIKSITNAAKSLVGDSTLWDGRKPVGNQFIRIDYVTGDFAWYRISSIDSDTTITLEKAYQGATISAATETYTLGEFPLAPPNFHNLGVYRGLAIAFDYQEESAQANRWWKAYDGGLEAGIISGSRPGGLLARMVKEQAGMLDAGYFPPRGTRRRGLTPEERSLNDTFVFG